ncbi:MAG TPA: polysaccharide deacetylase family protein [Solirubrobacteraceae bacterium]|jgi:peptidoglycan/xylan/chitin deacetylase (PgdA/CDA1 family)|nr:polysaccharide deacetylase family protein [Solirubrobacteraceae bacterium]
MDAEELQRRREERAAARRRRRIRRRAGIGGTLAVVVIAVAVAIAAASGSGGATGVTTAKRTQSTATTPHAKARPRPGAGRHVRGESTASILGPATGVRGTASVPVLMYHVIAAPPSHAPFPGLYVLPQEFAAQMQALKKAGWRAVTLDQLQAYWTKGAKLPAGKPIVITFDNGYHSQYTEALPVLRKMGWVADENMQLSGLPPSQGGLTTSEVKDMVNAGWELDTQGISHADLITLDAAQLHDQIDSARKTIQRRYGVPVNWFCYPSGHYDTTVINAVRAAGYIGSTTVIPGWAGPSSDPYRLPRLRVLGGTSPTSLLTQIADNRTATAPPGSYGGA